MKISKILHIGKIICEGAALALGIAALFTPAAPIVITAAICGLIAWVLDNASESIKEEEHVIINIQLKEETEDDSNFSSGDSDDYDFSTSSDLASENENIVGHSTIYVDEV